VNRFVPEDYSETFTRLALGIEPQDALRGRSLPRPVTVTLDAVQAPVTDISTRVDSHGSGRFAVRFGPGVESPVNVRFLDPTRHYVPRRISFPIVGIDEVTAAEITNLDVPVTRRQRRPALFPGAAYDQTECATGVRCRARRDGRPLRWARAEASLVDGPVIGRAHGDDRGELLLVLTGDPDSSGDLPDLLEVDVTVFGRDPATLPAEPALPALDPLWDLPLEMAASPGVAVDPVAKGVEPPPAYTRTATRRLGLELGRITSIQQPFVV
jgi:hypothetical protein